MNTHFNQARRMVMDAMNEGSSGNKWAYLLNASLQLLDGLHELTEAPIRELPQRGNKTNIFGGDNLPQLVFDIATQLSGNDIRTLVQELQWVLLGTEVGQSSRVAP